MPHARLTLTLALTAVGCCTVGYGLGRCAAYACIWWNNHHG